MADKSFHIKSLVRDAGTQTRAHIPQDAVDDYAAHLDKLPPIVVYSDGKRNILADGFIRVLAHEKEGKTTIKAKVKHGSIDDAKWYAAHANITHGLRRTNEDKANAVSMALANPKSAKMSDNQLAQHCGVSDKTVAKYRESLQSTSEIPKSDTRVGTDGREQSVSSGKRSESAKERHAREREEMLAKLCAPVREAAENDELKPAQIKQLAELEPVYQREQLKKIREAAAKKTSRNAPSRQVVTGHRTPERETPPANQKPTGIWAPSHKAIGKLSRTVDECAAAAQLSTTGPRIKEVHAAIGNVKKLIIALEGRKA